MMDLMFIVLLSRLLLGLLYFIICVEIVVVKVVLDIVLLELLFVYRLVNLFRDIVLVFVISWYV